MGLRGKVVITLVAIIVPLTALFTYIRIDAAQDQKIVRRVERFSNRLPPRMLNRCNRRPDNFVFDRDRVKVFSYSPEFVSRNPNAPTFPDGLKSVTDEPLSEFNWLGNYEGRTAVRASETGPCALLLIQSKRGGPAPPIPVKGIVLQSFLVFLTLCLVGLLIAVPLVRRILKLKEAVEDAADNGFDGAQFDGNDELAELAAAFDGSYASLQERDKTLKEYVANTTHDLAIPLTVIQHRLRRLQNSELSDDARELVDTTLEESHYIASLVANMSAAAKLGSDPKIDQFDLGEIIERIVERHQPIADQKGIELNFAVPDEADFLLDSVLAEQAISNLVQNAIQYNVAGGHVAVVLDRAGDGFILTVTDDGPGVPETQLGSLTTREARGDDARNRNPGGQGFGLSIARRVCEVHGWTLRFENADPGLRVSITS